MVVMEEEEEEEGVVIMVVVVVVKMVVVILEWLESCYYLCKYIASYYHVLLTIAI